MVDAGSTESQPNPTIRRRTRELLADFLSYTTAHGVGRLADARTIMNRIMWTVFVIGAFVGFFVETHQLFMLYLSHPVSTIVTVKSETQATFPAVTICNLNVIKITEMFQRRDLSDALFDEYRRKGNELKNKGRLHEKEEDEYDVDLELNHWFIEILKNKLAAENFTALAKLGHKYPDLVFDCNFRGRDCRNYSKHWSYFWNHRYGNCFTFNGGTDDEGRNQTVLVTRSTGPSGGLKLNLYIELREYIHRLSHSGGARIVIHSQGDMPFPDDEGQDLSTGCSTSVGIRREILERVDRFGNGSCIINNADGKDTLYSKRFGARYSKEACMKTCLAEAQLKSCGCAESIFPIDDNLVCDSVSNDTTDTCLSELARKFNERDLDCDKTCPFACSEVGFKLAMSMADWPIDTEHKESLLKRVKKRGKSLVEQSPEEDPRYLEKNFIQVQVFYETMNYQEIREERSYGLVKLMADIGGQLGLWIGISALTCCEVLELVMLIIKNMFKKLATRSEKEKQDPTTI